MRLADQMKRDQKYLHEKEGQRDCTCMRCPAERCCQPRALCSICCQIEFKQRSFKATTRELEIRRAVTDAGNDTARAAQTLGLKPERVRQVMALFAAVPRKRVAK